MKIKKYFRYTSRAVIFPLWTSSGQTKVMQNKFRCFHTSLRLYRFKKTGKTNPKFSAPYLMFRSERPVALTRTAINLQHPAWLYPKARAIKREIHLHIGPTNSGKSYTALQAFKKARTGVYAGPLRMLAREVNERMESENIPCNLVTGDEVLIKESAGLYSATVEMVNLNETIDVAVIDEIQMISDPERGWAWTRALLGVRAKSVHLCGDPSTQNLIEQICKETGDSLYVHEYKRLSPLTVSSNPLAGSIFYQKGSRNAKQLKSQGMPAGMNLGTLKYLQPGDCIVCFAKKTALQIRDMVVKACKHKQDCCAVIHGSLPPETRALQARLFNDPKSSTMVLVATDAIGMGLNLGIKRVIFTALKKFDGHSKRMLTISEIKQIAGRAGRYKTLDGSDGGSGTVACFTPEDIQLVKHALATDTPAIKAAVYTSPTNELRSAFIDSRPGEFSLFLSSAVHKSKYGSVYTAPREHSSVLTARLFDQIKNLTFEDRMVLSFAPVSLKNQHVVRMFQKMCQVVADCTSGNIVQLLPELVRILSNSKKLGAENLEIVHKVLSLYLWLSYRFPCNFMDRQGAQELKAYCEQQFAELLSRKKRPVNA